MRILYHHRTLGDGAEGIHINEMIRAFRNLGCEVRVVALVGDQTNQKTAIDSAKPQKRWSMLGRLMPGIAYELAELGYNVVGRRAMDRAIGEFQPDLIYDRYNSFSTAAVDAANNAKIPVFLEVNAPVAFERTAYERRPLRLSRLAQRFERRICNVADHVIAVSTPLKQFLMAERGVTESRITVIPNGVDPEKFKPLLIREGIKKRLGIENKTVIGFVGILRPWHGLEFLLEAFQSLVTQQDSIHLLIVGDGTIEPSLKQRVSELGLDGSVTFTGRVPHDDMNQYLAAIDIAISPRATFYASPMKILEYMAMGIPTVAPDMANIRDLISDGENGLLFEPENQLSLKKALGELLKSKELVTRIGRMARNSIVNKRNWNDIAQEIITLSHQIKR